MTTTSINPALVRIRQPQPVELARPVAPAPATEAAQHTELRAPIADALPVAQRAPGSSAAASPLMVARCGTRHIPTAEVGPKERAHPEGVYDVTARAERGIDTGPAGNKLKFESNALVIRDKVTGFGTHEVMSNQNDVDDLRRQFTMRGDVAPYPHINPRAPDWTISRTFMPTGGWGALASVAVLDYAYDGGGKGFSRCELATFHYETGMRMNLNDMLSPDDKSLVVMQLLAQLKQSPDAASFTAGKSVQQLVDEAMKNFAMFPDKDGTAKLTVAILSGCHATDGAVLQATMDAPRSLIHAAGLG